MNWSMTILIPLLPLLSFVVVGLFGPRFGRKISGLIGTFSIVLSAFISLITAFKYFLSSGMDGHYSVIIPFNMEWLRFSDRLHIDMGILLDPISVMMLVVITLISSLVHIYSLGYMKGDVGYERYFSFLSLFTFSMLGLVIATNIFQMYMFWELVGVSSYLLIGHYYDKPSAVAASKKAFIVTRFADLGFLLGILMLSYFTGSFDFQTLTDPDQAAYTQNSGVAFLGLSVVSWALILVFIGGAGKSAMFPLHIWLPDAMEGPTPVSALIHAATMVVAGVYLVARLFPLYLHVAPDALQVVAFTGALTSLFAALIACTQEDIKRVLAYSTMSQLGYMMLALGVSSEINDNLGFTASMFHLFTHAMFKALLFLGAGAVIHAVHSNLMKDMGGLRKLLPLTSLTFLIACLAISGIPPFAGFFSKDEILSAAIASNKWYFAVELLVAGLTAYYMFRLYFRIFWNKQATFSTEIHEAPATMTIPLIVLAALSMIVGFIPFGQYVSWDMSAHHGHINWYLALSSTVVALLGILIAMKRFKGEVNPDATKTGLYRVIENKFYIDEVYVAITRNVIYKRISQPVAWFDRNIVDGAMNGVAWITNATSSRIKSWQSGQLQDYLLAFSAGVVVLFIVLMYLVR
ncbi:MAG: NADH-quinone oxidoreductase subunit L [Vicingaceae bacterium]